MPYTLLLADDSVTIQRVIELTFADEDVTVIAVGDGDQAIERLDASPPDIVLADIGMPGKNGYEVAQYMRQSPKLAHIPVVLLTGAFEPVDQARAAEAGCDGVLAKPFEPQMVISRVKELLAQGGAGQGSAGLPPPASPAPPAAPDDSMWAPQLVTPAEAPPAPAPVGAAPSSELDDYFDRLDVAFSSLSSSAAEPSAPAAEPARVAIETEIDWFGTQTAEGPSAEPWDLPAPPSDAAEPADLPLAYASQSEAPPAATVEVAADVEAASAAPTADPAASTQEVAGSELDAPTPEPEPPAAADIHFAPTAVPPLELPLRNPPPLPALADAFAALLAAEQGESPASTAHLWPASLAPTAAQRDELVDDVARRVLDRLSDTVVREAVTGIASAVAERLVREEIERIKASIK